MTVSSLWHPATTNVFFVVMLSRFYFRKKFNEIIFVSSSRFERPVGPGAPGQVQLHRQQRLLGHVRSDNAGRPLVRETAGAALWSQVHVPSRGRR